MINIFLRELQNTDIIRSSERLHTWFLLHHSKDYRIVLSPRVAHFTHRQRIVILIGTHCALPSRLCLHTRQHKLPGIMNLINNNNDIIEQIQNTQSETRTNQTRFRWCLCITTWFTNIKQANRAF